MYQTGYVCYGVDLSSAPAKFAEDIQLLDLEELIESRYSGDNEAPEWVGIQKDCFDMIGKKNFSSMPKEPEITDEDKIEFKATIKAIENFFLNAEEGEENITQEFIDWLKDQEPTSSVLAKAFCLVIVTWSCL